jgi:hypothetical protein
LLDESMPGSRLRRTALGDDPYISDSGKSVSA